MVFSKIIPKQEQFIKTCAFQTNKIFQTITNLRKSMFPNKDSSKLNKSTEGFSTVHAAGSLNRKVLQVTRGISQHDNFTVNRKLPRIIENIFPPQGGFFKQSEDIFPPQGGFFKQSEDIFPPQGGFFIVGLLLLIINNTMRTQLFIELGRDI